MSEQNDKGKTDLAGVAADDFLASAAGITADKGTYTVAIVSHVRVIVENMQALRGRASRNLSPGEKDSIIRTRSSLDVSRCLATASRRRWEQLGE